MSRKPKKPKGPPVAKYDDIDYWKRMRWIKRLKGRPQGRGIIRTPRGAHYEIMKGHRISIMAILQNKEDSVREELFSKAWRSDDPADADVYDQYTGAGKFRR